MYSYGIVAPYSFSALTFSTLYGSDLTTCISVIKIVKIILDAGEITDTVCSVYAIVDCNKSYIILWEYAIHERALCR